ncbi:MAG: 3-oxoacyl-ACP synthase, partial [Coriobacteriales bacterium]|nr:3-oxoacyl-ACP synthase [Coriobacteriales bacterium]
MRILATGSATPAKVLTNEQLATMVDTSDEWIHSRTGIKTRHIAVQETTLTLARDAAQQALRRAAIAPERIGVILCATVTHEIRCPSLAC